MNNNHQSNNAVSTENYTKHIMQWMDLTGLPISAKSDFVAIATL